MVVDFSFSSSSSSSSLSACAVCVERERGEIKQLGWLYTPVGYIGEMNIHTHTHTQVSFLFIRESRRVSFISTLKYLFLIYNVGALPRRRDETKEIIDSRS